MTPTTNDQPATVATPDAKGGSSAPTLLADGWTATQDREWMHIHDEDGNKICTWFRHLTLEELLVFKEGWEVGLRIGLDRGALNKAAEIKAILHL